MFQGYIIEKYEKNNSSKLGMWHPFSREIFRQNQDFNWEMSSKMMQPQTCYAYRFELMPYTWPSKHLKHFCDSHGSSKVLNIGKYSEIFRLTGMSVYLTN